MTQELHQDIPAPIAKHELVMMRCPNPRAISVCIATQQAYQWLSNCRCYFDDVLFDALPGSRIRLPMTTALIVPECYDFEEVWNYVSNKPWVRHTASDSAFYRVTNL